MENDIPLMVSAYVFTRLGILAAVGYVVFLVLRPEPVRVRIEEDQESVRAQLSAQRSWR